jgi:hypothetical protein
MPVNAKNAGRNSVLNVGLDLRTLSPTLFAMLVLMAVIATVATTPIHWITRHARGVSEGR